LRFVSPVALRAGHSGASGLSARRAYFAASAKLGEHDAATSYRRTILEIANNRAMGEGLRRVHRSHSDLTARWGLFDLLSSGGGAFKGMSSVREPSFLPLSTYQELPAHAMESRVADFEAHLQRRRTVRQFSDRPVSRSIIEKCLLCAGTAPSGAHQQPWHFVAVSDPLIKSQIRAAAEHEEREFYHRRAPKEWLEALRPLGTDEHKPYLEIAPWLIGIFLKRFTRLPDKGKLKHYYTDESVGIATGFLIAAVHAAGLVSLTHTPNPMGFLTEILGRPKDIERPYMLLVVGYPAADAKVPDIVRKPLGAISTFIPP
jgi:nitroreductase